MNGKTNRMRFRTREPMSKDGKIFIPGASTQSKITDKIAPIA